MELPAGTQTTVVGARRSRCCVAAEYFVAQRGNLSEYGTLTSKVGSTGWNNRCPGNQRLGRKGQ